MSDPDLTLYRLQACPFCERVVRTLEELAVPYRSRFVEPLHSERTVVKRLTGVRTVPAIVDEDTGVTMAESGNIVEYLERTYGDGDANDGDANDGDANDGDANPDDDDADDSDANADTDADGEADRTAAGGGA